MQHDTYTKEQALKEFAEYSETQKGNYVPPEVGIQFVDEDDKVSVHMKALYGNVIYSFESVQAGDAHKIYDEINGVAEVRAKYANGLVPLEDANEKRIATLSERFHKAEDRLHLYGGFTVSDEETGSLIGFCNTGGSSYQANYAEIAFLNPVKAWSHRPANYIGQPDDKQYKGVATVEISALEQYHRALKAKGYKIGGQELGGIDMTARIDNPGSWKAAAKNGFEVYDVDKNKHSDHLRYQLKKPLI